jgi:hypothetical protein
MGYLERGFVFPKIADRHNSTLLSDLGLLLQSTNPTSITQISVSIPLRIGGHPGSHQPPAFPPPYPESEV